MTTMQKTSGQAGSFTFQTKNGAGDLITPFSTPVVKWYTDTARTLGELILTVTGSGSDWTVSWTSAQAPADESSRYLTIRIEMSSGVFAPLDANDDLQFTTAVAEPDTTSADISLIRLLISDLSDPPIFPDSQLQQLLDLEGAVRLAAASALDVIASNEALVSKRIRTLDLQTDGPAVAKALREHAAVLRAQHLSALEDGDDEIQATTDLGWAQFPGLTGPEITQGW